MSDFTVTQRGLDSSGRELFATAYMWAWWDRVCDELGFAPVIVQGAFMTRVPGGGADASAGYHDAAGCLDLRVWDITEDQVAKTIRTLRRHGAAAWVRDERHGMDPHIHLVLGADRPLADGAAWQWQQYLEGRDGLSSGGRDYHWRPAPIVTTPPPPEDDMPLSDEDVTRVATAVRQALADRDKRMNTRLARANQLLRVAARSDRNAADALAEISEAMRELAG